ncbi:unnamed protein product [Meganyctiphanes norvegica]|uniref:Odorant receptor n=1 Tax=Meganyctiphanes norvegica TaxID=48144 RepID=A0AAV2RX02_MEGNR
MHSKTALGYICIDIQIRKSKFKTLIVVMAEADCDLNVLLQEMLSVDNDERVRTLCFKLIQISHHDFFELVNEHVKLIFNTRHCADLIINKNMLLHPEECPDPYIQLGLLCFKCTFRMHYGTYDFMMHKHVIITISQIDVDKYLSYLDGSLFNTQLLKSLIDMMFDKYPFASAPSLEYAKKYMFEVSILASKLNKTFYDVMNEMNANMINLLTQLILISIKCLEISNNSDILPVSNNIVKFFHIYYKIEIYFLEGYCNILPFIDKSIMSGIAVMTNCILLFQAKLIASNIDSLYWSKMIYMMEMLRDHMAISLIPLSSGVSLQRFLIDRAHGNFSTNCTNKLYMVTNYIKYINISERYSDIIFKTSLRLFKHVLNELDTEVKTIYSEGEHDISNSSDEFLSTSGSEGSSSDTVEI